MDKILSEKKALELKLHEAGKDRDEIRRLKENAKSKEDDLRSEISDLNRDKEHLKEQIEVQKKEILRSHRTSEGLQKTLDFYKSQFETIEKEYGGVKGIDETMRIARLKEQTIGNLIKKLSSVFDSTENQLSCFKCMSLMTDAVMLIPCGHALCRTCIKPDDSQQYCPECDKRVTAKSNCAIISDLSLIHI